MRDVSHFLDRLPTLSWLRQMAPQERWAYIVAHPHQWPIMNKPVKHQIYGAPDLPPNGPEAPIFTAHERIKAHVILQAALERLHTTLEQIHACYDAEHAIVGHFRLMNQALFPALQHGRPIQPELAHLVEQIQHGTTLREAQFIGIHPTHLQWWIDNWADG